MKRLINGIQQVGVGVTDARLAFAWYKKYFGFNTIVFEDKAKASLMYRYTGGEVHERYAVLAMNMQGGGGLEIWQYTSRTPAHATKATAFGDIGIFAIKIKCRDIDALYASYSQDGTVHIVSDLATDIAGNRHFFIRDPFDNLFQLIENGYWFQDTGQLTGGVCGAMIGVKSLDESAAFYTQVLDYSVVAFKKNSGYDQVSPLQSDNRKFKNIELQHQPLFRGAFSELLGPTSIELVEAEGETKKIFENRYWGDPGFIHVCYDVSVMEDHEGLCKLKGHPFTVNSLNSFEMGSAAGHFAYNEDPDGTLIEYVETHKVPILKSLGWYLNLRKRENNKALPRWLVKCTGFSKSNLEPIAPSISAGHASVAARA